jgi:hypothetical protein
MTRFRWWLAGLLTLALPASSALGQTTALATLALACPLGHETPEDPADDAVRPNSQVVFEESSVCAAACRVHALLEAFLDKWALLWHAGEFQQAEHFAARAVQLCPSSVDAQHAFVVSQILNTTSTTSRPCCTEGCFTSTAVPVQFEVEVQAGCLPYGQLQWEEVREAALEAAAMHYKKLLELEGLIKARVEERKAHDNGLIQELRSELYARLKEHDALLETLQRLTLAKKKEREALTECTNIRARLERLAGTMPRVIVIATPACTECAQACGNGKSCCTVAAVTSATPPGCACAKPACACCPCAAKAKCACGAGCACAKPACACGAKCACAKPGCSCCQGCGCAKTPKVRTVHVAVPMMSHGVSEIHGFPIMPHPVMLPMPAPMPMPNADYYYPCPACPAGPAFPTYTAPACPGCPIMPPPLPPAAAPMPTAPVLDVSRRMPGYPMPPAPPLAPVMHYEYIQAPTTAVAPDEDCVRIVARDHGMTIQCKCFHARCDHLTMQQSKDTVVLEGNVHLEVNRENHPARIEAHKVVVNLKTGTFEVSGAGSMRISQPLTTQPVNRTLFSAPMPTPMPQRPMPNTEEFQFWMGLFR